MLDLIFVGISQTRAQLNDADLNKTKNKYFIDIFFNCFHSLAPVL